MSRKFMSGGTGPAPVPAPPQAPPISIPPNPPRRLRRPAVGSGAADCKGPGVPPAGCGKPGSPPRSLLLQNLPTPALFFSVDLEAKLLSKPPKERALFPDAASVKAAVVEYQRFFVLMCSHKAECVVPSQRQDEVWHEHMLNPKAYLLDCLAYAGELIDHCGGFGRTEEERPQLDEAFEFTKKLWAATFGETHPAMASWNCKPGRKPAGASPVTR